MEFSWSTFALEIVNFVVLVVILKRFLYRPVLDVIERRRQAVEAGLSEARRVHEEAETLKAQYGRRLSDWQNEQRQARDALAHEIEGERARRLSALTAELEEEKQRLDVAAERRSAEKQRALESEAMRQAGAFARRLLEQAAGPELEARLIDLLVSELAALTPEQIAGLEKQWGETEHPIEVTSAYALTPAQSEAIESALRTLSSPSVPIRFAQDEHLLAGLRISIGAWVLAANVRDELRGFTEIAHANG